MTNQDKPKASERTQVVPEAELVAKLTTYEEYERVKQQRDELLADFKAVNAVLNQPVQFSDGHGGSFSIIQGDCAAARRIIEAAIARAEEGRKTKEPQELPRGPI